MQKLEELARNQGLFNLYERYKSIIRFIIVGCINTGVDFVLFSIMNILGYDKLVCQIAGYGAGIINSYVLNKIWTFENRSRSANMYEFLRFAAVNCISLIVSLSGLEFINGYCGVNIYVSKIIITGITQIVNYMGYKLLVFNNKFSSILIRKY